MADRTTEEAKREAFEAHMKADWGGDPGSNWRNPDGSYVYTESEWLAFQAALQWQAEQQKGEAGIDALALYKELADLTAEAGAVDTLIGRPEVLRARLAKLRDAVGAAKNCEIPLAASPHGVPPGREDLIDRLVAISSAVAEQDDRAAQAMLGECLRLLNDKTALMLSSLPQAPQGEQWISVHERLPELTVDNEDDGVKVYTWDGEFVTEDVFAPEYEQPAGPAVGGWLRTGDWFCSDTAARVTHWMLRRQPAPPPLAQGDSQ